MLPEEFIHTIENISYKHCWLQCPNMSHKKTPFGLFLAPIDPSSKKTFFFCPLSASDSWASVLGPLFFPLYTVFLSNFIYPHVSMC